MGSSAPASGRGALTEYITPATIRAAVTRELGLAHGSFATHGRAKAVHVGAFPQLQLVCKAANLR